MSILTRLLPAGSAQANDSSAPSFLTLMALGLAAAMVLFSILNPQQFMAFTHAANLAFLDVASDVVIIACSLLLIGALMIVLSPLGNIRLGDSAPEFSTLSWLAMLFATGMGAGLLYWGVAEPVIHLTTPPPYQDAMAEVGDARMAMVISYLHWAFHPWGIYAAGALCIAYFSFCKGYPLLPSAPFRSMLTNRFGISQRVGDVVDVACVISTLLGISAALAAGTMQIASGSKWLGYNPSGGMFPTYFTIIALLAVAYLASAATPIGKGIKHLSELNMVMALFMILLIAYYTPAIHESASFMQTVTDYLHFLPSLSFSTLGGAEQPEWGHIWTANYFLSWISWVPFVGIFIARISRGRSLREFLLGVILAPSLFTFMWFYILGNTALDIQLSGTRDLAMDIMADTGAGLFSLLSLLPHAQLLWGLVVVLVFIFLITSTDSASYVLAMMAERGEENPSVKSKLFWGCAIAVLTLTPLFADNGIHSVRALFSFAGISVFFILLFQSICLGIGLLKHPKP